MRLLLNSFVTGAILAASCCAAPDMAGHIDAIVRQPSQKNALFCVVVYDVQTGRCVYAHNAERAVPPASNMKLVVTAAAVDRLGFDFEFETIVGMAGETLAVIGGGDPLFGDRVNDARYGRGPSWIPAAIVEALRAEGCDRIKDIIVDTGVFDDVRVHPAWPDDQLNRWYACEVCGLNYNDNCIDLTVTNLGGTAVVSLDPETGFLGIENKVAIIGDGTGAVGAYRTAEANRIVLKGRCRRQQGPFSVAIERPAAFFAYLLAEHLVRSGITVEGSFVEKRVERESVRVLKVFKTPLADCLARSNKDSLGLAAESLLKTVGASSLPGGAGGSWDLGRQAIHAYLRKIGVSDSQFYVDDGSGLSRANRLSADAIARVLMAVYNGPGRQVYMNSLAVAGVDGTIHKYFGEESYKGRILGKTGYIAGVKSFSGYCRASGDRWYVFSILTNGANGKTRKAINDIAKAVVDAG